MRVVTWNIHGCVGSRQSFDPHAVTGVIRHLRPDILALQEVDARFERTLRFDAFAHFADHGGGHAVEARTLKGEDGDYGHMLVSRWPIRKRAVHDISHSGREPRQVIDAYVERNGRAIRVLAAHLGLNLKERRAQIAALSRIVGHDEETPTLLVGDFNQLRRRGRLHKALSPDFGFSAAPRTFPAKRPLFPLDRIWARPSHLVESTWAFTEARDASDHLPLVADLRWAGDTITGRAEDGHARDSDEATAEPAEEKDRR